MKFSLAIAQANDVVVMNPVLVDNIILLFHKFVLLNPFSFASEEE